MSPVLALFLWIAGFQIRQDVPRASVEGVVVRAGAAAAGAPEALMNAQVEIRPGNLSASTDTGGAFSFKNLPPGKYTISVTHAGFVPLEDAKRGLTESGLTLTLTGGLALKDIVIPMIPAPVITGTVFDPNGEPLAAALIRAYVREYSPYGTKLKIFKRTMTNDMGEFRLFGLRFGEYLVSAGYSDRDRAAAVGNTQLTENVTKADDGYATVFYDGAEELSRARSARLTPGSDSAPLNLYLKDSARFKIRGLVLPRVQGRRIVFVPKGSDLAEEKNFLQPNADDSFEIRAVSPGSYLLLALTDDGTMSSEVVTVSITDRDIDGITLALVPTLHLSGSLNQEGNARANLSRFHVKLTRSTTEFDQTFDTVAAPDGTLSLDQIPFAEYNVAVGPLSAGLYVKSVMAGARNFLDGGYRPVLGQPLQIVLGTSTDNLQVSVQKDGNAAAGALVVLIPQPPLRHRADRYITGSTDANGNVTLNAVPPGRYTAYAFEEMEAGAYYALGSTPGSDVRFHDRGLSLTIGENGAKAIQLRLIPAAVTAGGLQ
jgi:carboxypeptidase family protein